MRRDEFEVLGLLASLLIDLTLEPLLPRGDKEGSFESLRCLDGLFCPETWWLLAEYYKRLEFVKYL